MELTLVLDGAPRPMARSALMADGQVAVPLRAFCDLVDAEVVDLDGQGSLGVCVGEDLCLVLQPGSSREMDGELYADLDSFSEGLGLRWQVDGATLRVTTGAIGAGEAVAPAGLGVGQRPPAFTLPDLRTGELVSADVYRGKPAVFYMWASW